MVPLIPVVPEALDPAIEGVVAADVPAMLGVVEPVLPDTVCP